MNLKDAYWFSHDSNAKDDPKTMLLIDQLGLEGYGIFWVLIETLRDQPRYKCPLILLPVLAKRYATSYEKMLAVVKKYSLFEIEGDEFFFSESLNRRMVPLEEKREQARRAGIKSGEVRRLKSSKSKDSSTDVQRMMNGGRTSRVKEKEKEKENTHVCFDVFEAFRKHYPAKKRGGKTEFENFVKKHQDWEAVLPALLPALEKQIAIRNTKTAMNKFAENWKHLSTWINNRCWEEEEGGAPIEPPTEESPPSSIPRNPAAEKANRH